MKKKRYDILSPDGISLDYENTYATPEEAWAAFDEWKKRYEQQGYYSSNSGRIPLDELKDRCKLITV